MNRLDHTDIIKGIRDLPALPLVVAELIRSFDQPEVSTGAVADWVSQDQALAAKTLRLANSSFYGLTRKVKTIQQAITVVGFDSVRSMIIAVGIIDAFAGTADTNFNFTGFWQHAIGTALCAKGLARACNLSQDDGFISGLLHDIGTLVLVTQFPQQHAAAMAERAARDCHAVEAERHLLGTDHAAVGRALAEHWKFPTLIQEAIAHHHSLIVANGGIPSVVHVGNGIAHAMGLGGQDDDLVPPISDKAWDSLRLDEASLRRVFRDAEAQFDEACQTLAI